MPNNFSGGDFRILDGKVFWNENKRSEILPTNNSEVSKKYNGDGLYVLGAPALVVQRSMLSIANIPETNWGISRSAKVEDDVVIVSNFRVSSESEKAISSYRIAKIKDGILSTIVEFELKDNIYNEYLAGVFPIGNKIIAIVSASARHSFINTLYLVDIKKGHIVGVKGFGKIQYIPSDQSFRFAAQVPNSENAADVIIENEKNQITIPLFKGGDPSGELLSDLDSIIIKK